MQPTEAIHKALGENNATLFRETLARHPELKKRINDPLGPFDSPLILTVKTREMLDAFLEAGADINARSRWWAGSFGILDNASDEVAAHALKRGARLDVHAAARLGLIDELRRMVAADKEAVHARGGDGKTPLHCARTVEIARLLVEHGADINARDIDHESTPAQYLVGEQRDIVRYLVAENCEADIFIAAALGDTVLAQRLVEADPGCLGTRVNNEYFPMRDPRAGGTIYQWTLGFNVSPQEVARKLGNTETYAFLLERSPNELRLLHHCWVGDEAEVHALLAQDPGVVARLRPSDLRQLADAARNNNLEAVRLMLAAGLPLTARGQHDGMALHWAAWHGNTRMTQLLIDRGAALEDAANDFKCSPLAWAMHGSENGWHRQAGDYPGTARALLQAGARVPNRTDGTAEIRQAIASYKVK